MAILIGGSPSTGSSLLRRILNRHSKVFCGSESSIFCKPGLYENWNRNRHKLFRKSVFGLKNAGWHHLVGLTMEDDYHLSSQQIKSIAAKSQDSFKQFITSFYAPALNAHQKSIWAEKTPANVFCFKAFAKTFENAKLIHIVRHPQDSIASLVNRGMPAFQAVAVYLLSTSAGLNAPDQSLIFTIRYEDLVGAPESTLKQLMNYLELDYEDQMVEADKNVVGTDHMKGWRYRESGTIASGSIGRFNMLDEQQQVELNSYLHFIQTNLYGEYRNISEIASHLNYQLAGPDHQRKYNRVLSNLKTKDQLNRTFRMANFNILNYPLVLND